MITYSSTSQEILFFLQNIDSSFTPSLSTRIKLEDYALKLDNNAKIIAIKQNKEIVSAIFYYENHLENKVYVPIVATVDGSQGKGYFNLLLDELIIKLKGTNFKSIELETWEGGKAANYYIKRGFSIYSKVKEIDSNRISLKLFKKINYSPQNIDFEESPITKSKYLSDLLNNEIYIKRDDLLPSIAGGSKVRKLFYILKEAKNNGNDIVITCGSNESSHLRSTAILCAELGLKCISIIHDNRQDSFSHNIKLIHFYSTKVVYCDLFEVKKVMDEQVNICIDKNFKPYYLYGGGHNEIGTYAFVDAIKRLHESKIIEDLDYVFLASGTGTTQAGLAIGLSNYFPKTKLIGISIARSCERGKAEIVNSIKSYENNFELTSNNDIEIIFDDNFLDGGYGKCSDANQRILNQYSKKTGIPLDSTYSGKAFIGMLNYLGDIQNKKILFWNTGSMLNFIDKL